MKLQKIAISSTRNIKMARGLGCVRADLLISNMGLSKPNFSYMRNPQFESFENLKIIHGGL